MNDRAEEKVCLSHFIEARNVQNRHQVYKGPWELDTRRINQSILAGLLTLIINPNLIMKDVQCFLDVPNVVFWYVFRLQKKKVSSVLCQRLETVKLHLYADTLTFPLHTAQRSLPPIQRVTSFQSFLKSIVCTGHKKIE